VSLHDDALSTLRTWQAPDAAQDDLRARFVTHLEAQPDGMWRTCYPDHLTAGCLVLDEGGARVLLNLHRKARRWFAFGGHAEPGDATLVGVARREAAEESGIEGLQFHPDPLQLDIHVVPFCDPRGGVSHLDVRYAATAPREAREQISDESLQVRWWPVGALPPLEPAMLRLIDQARTALR